MKAPSRIHVGAGRTAAGPSRIVRGLTALLVALTLTATVVIVRTVAAGNAAPIARLTFPAPAFDAALAVAHLSEALRIETVSFDDVSDASALEAMRTWLSERYPRLHAVAERTVVGGGTLIYEWKGGDASLAPIVLMAHQDVVPVPEPERWRRPPFSGLIVDGEIWGRGALDNKSSLVAIAEAAESLIAAGHIPQRTVYFVFGHDEESGGAGARAAAEWLAQRKVRAEFVLDEGGVTLASDPVTRGPATLIGVAEKGYVTLQLSVAAAGGHSNAPPPATAVDVLANALVAVRNRPFEARYDGVAKTMLEALAPRAPLMARTAIANGWLFERLLLGQLSSNPAGAALLQTTVAPTMLQGSPKQNVLPSTAAAKINFRILPGETIESVTAHVRESVAHLPVEIAVVGPRAEPSPIADAQSPGYRLVSGLAASMFDAPVAPTLIIGLTDSRHMKDVSDDIYRYLPIRVSLDDLAIVHGLDERISIENFTRMISFYQQLMVGASARFSPSSAPVPGPHT